MFLIFNFQHTTDCRLSVGFVDSSCQLQKEEFHRTHRSNNEIGKTVEFHHYSSYTMISKQISAHTIVAVDRNSIPSAKLLHLRWFIWNSAALSTIMAEATTRIVWVSHSILLLVSCRFTWLSSLCWHGIVRVVQVARTIEINFNLEMWHIPSDLVVSNWY